MNFRERYKYDPVSDKLGSGGFATVFKAHDILLDREVALKIFHTNENIKVNFLSELQRMSKLDHPNLIRCHDILSVEVTNIHGLSEHLNIGVMEYANGGSLQDSINKNNPVSKEILIQILQGLSYLHSRSTIHRDLKPQNILFSKHGNELTAKISDFGISKALSGDDKSSSVLIGANNYMAPEQFNPQRYGIDGRISTNLDLWNFGILTYQWITQKQLFRENNHSSEQVMNSILSFKLPEDIDRIEEPFQTVIRKCLVTDANQRVKDAKELITLLKPPSNRKTAQTTNEGQTVVINKSSLEKNIGHEKIESGKESASVNSGHDQAELKTINKPGRKKWLLPVAGLLLILIIGGIYIARSSGFNYKSDNNTQSATGDFDSTAIYKKEKWIEAVRNYEDVEPFSDGLAKVYKDKKLGFINKEGKMVLELEYENVFPFSEGLARVTTNYKHGFIDTTGKLVIDLKFDDAEDFSHGLAPVKLNGNWGYIDRTGKVVIPFKFFQANKFSEGLAAVTKSTGDLETGYIDTTGKLVIDYRFRYAREFSEGLAPVEMDRKFGFIDKKGNKVIDYIYDGAFEFREGLASVQIGKKRGFIDKSGKLVIDTVFDFAVYFSEGWASVRQNGFMGYIDKTGKFVIQPKYLFTYPFSNGLGRVHFNDKWFYVDKTGREIK